MRVIRPRDACEIPVLGRRQIDQRVFPHYFQQMSWQGKLLVGFVGHVGRTNSRVALRDNEHNEDRIIREGKPKAMLEYNADLLSYEIARQIGYIDVADILRKEQSSDSP